MPVVDAVPPRGFLGRDGELDCLSNTRPGCRSDWAFAEWGVIVFVGDDVLEPRGRDYYASAPARADAPLDVILRTTSRVAGGYHSLRLPQESWCLLRTAFLRPLVSVGEVCLVQEGDVPMGAAFVSFWRMCTGIRTRSPWAQCGVFPRSPQLRCSVHRVVPLRALWGASELSSFDAAWALTRARTWAA